MGGLYQTVNPIFPGAQQLAAMVEVTSTTTAVHIEGIGQMEVFNFFFMLLNLLLLF